MNADNYLTRAEREFVDRNGYFVARGLFSKSEVDEIRDVFMAQSANGPVPGLSDIRPLSEAVDQTDPLIFYPRMMNPHANPDLPVSEPSRRYMLDHRLYPILKELIGDEPAAVQSMFYFKPPKARGQELHQDNFYLRVKPGTCMAAWIAVDDVDAENGGMKVVPGSHLEIACPKKADTTTSFTIDYVPPPDGFDVVHCDMKAGDVLFFNGSLIHGSTPNTSETRFRRSLIFHYAPKASAELSEGYRNPMTFDGQIVKIPAAVGGGPCGTFVPLSPH